MAKLSTTGLVVAGAALITIGISAMTGTIHLTGGGGHHGPGSPSAGSASAGGPSAAPGAPPTQWSPPAAPAAVPPAQPTGGSGDDDGG